MFKTPAYIGDLSIDLAELSRSEIIELPISADITAGDTVFVSIDGTVAPATSGGPASGVALEAGVAADGDRVKVCIGGRCDAVCGSVTAGDRLAVNAATGRLDTATATDLRAQAVALETGSGSVAVRWFRSF